MYGFVRGAHRKYLFNVGIDRGYDLGTNNRGEKWTATDTGRAYLDAGLVWLSVL